jgi:hypothetical protein
MGNRRATGILSPSRHRRRRIDHAEGHVGAQDVALVEADHLDRIVFAAPGDIPSFSPTGRSLVKGGLARAHHRWVWEGISQTVLRRYLDLTAGLRSSFDADVCTSGHTSAVGNGLQSPT